MEIKQELITSTLYSLKCPYSMIPKYITVHDTANDASAKNEVKYMIGNPASTSCHVYVDDKEAIQAIPFNRNAWHAGDGKDGTGNRNSIGVEICYSMDYETDRHEKAYFNAVEVVQMLMNKYNIPIENVVQHNHWSDKDCPHRIREEGNWKQFLLLCEGGEKVSVEKNILKQNLTYQGATVKVVKIKKDGLIVRGSVDGNQYGKSYNITIPAGFSDKNLIAEGYTEALAGNGSIFYEYAGAHYADGLEVVQGGANNQDFNMACVSKFNQAMAVGFLHGEGLVFDRQINLLNSINQYYSALTFAFGIMKDGQKAEWGKEVHSSQYNCLSGRTILGQNDKYIFGVSIAGVTGKSGLYGSQLFELCEKLGMLDAGCFDGGGSVWMRSNGVYLNTTTRQVKNAWMIFAKEKQEEETEEMDGMFYIKIGKGTYAKNGKGAIPTRETALAKYDTAHPLYVGEVIGLLGDPINSNGEPVYLIGSGDQKGRYVLLESTDMKNGYFIPVVKQ